MTMRTIEAAAGWAWETSLAALPLIALAVVGTVVLRRAVFTPVRWVLWVLVVARLLLPFAPGSRFSVFNLAPAKISLAEVQLNHPSLSGLSAPYMTGPGVETPGSSRGVPFGTRETAGALEDGRAKNGVLHNGRSATVTTLLPVIWAFGVVAMIGRVVVQHLRVRRWIRRGREVVDGAAWVELEEAKKVSVLRRNIRLMVVKEISSPALFGFWGPVILLPPQVAEGSSARLRLVLLHEIAHVKRWDVLIKWLMIFARALHWFNPLVWLSARRLTAEQEMLCDRDVLRLVGAEEQRTYAETLLALASGASGAPATAISISANFKQLKERIGMIQQFKPGTRRWLVFVVPPLTAVVAIMTFTAAMKKPIPPQAATKSIADPSPKELEVKEKERAAMRISALREEYDRIRAQIDDRQQNLEGLRKKLRLLPAMSENGSEGLEAVRNLDRERLSAERDYVQLNTLYESLKGMKREQLRQAIPVAYKDDALDRYLADYGKTQQQLVVMRKDYADDHPDVLRLQALLKAVDGQIEARVDGVLSGLGTLVGAKRAVLEAIKKQLETEMVNQSDHMERIIPYFERKRDLETMQKMRDSLHMQLMEAEVNSRMPAK